MDVAGKGDRKDAAGRVHEDAHRLQGVAHDVFGLVGVRDLMQELGAGHVWSGDYFRPMQLA